MLDGPRVITQHGAFAHAEPTPLRHDNPAELERLGGLFDCLPSAGDAEIGVTRGKLLEETIDPPFEVAARD